MVCLLACSVCSAGQPQRIHVILGDGYRTMKVTDGTTFKLVHDVANAIAGDKLDALTLTVSPTVSYAGIEHRSICILIDSEDDTVLLSVPDQTSMQLTKSLVLALDENEQGFVKLLSRKTFDKVIEHIDRQGDDSAVSKTSGATAE